MPGLAGDDAAVADSLLVDKCSSSYFSVEADVFIAGNAFALREAGGSEYLNAVANGEDPLLLRVEFADDLEQAQIVAEVLRGTPAQNENGIVIGHVYLVEREVGPETVAGALDVGVPAWFKVVDDEVKAANGWGGNGGLPVCLLKAMNGV